MIPHQPHCRPHRRPHRLGRAPLRRLPAALFACALPLLAACGVDGPPSPPPPREDARPAPGITVSGTVEFGVAGGG